jgi:small GTP-binding protein
VVEVSMPTVRRMKTKLALMGESGVGKTSLVRRFVLNEYQDAYVPTVGTRVSRVELIVPHGADVEVQMEMSVFELMGQKGFKDLIRETYYHGAQALMAVCDFTRKESLDALKDWIPSALEIAGDVPVYIVVNKKDLEDKRAITDEEVRHFAESFKAPYVFTSARSGEFVDDAFNAIAIDMVGRAFRTAKAQASERGLRERLLALLEKRGSTGLKKSQLSEILGGVPSEALQAEVRQLEGEGLVTLLWHGAADFTAVITPRGMRATKQAAAWEQD